MTRRARGERGNVSLVVVVMIPALLTAAGLVLDGGRQLEARRDATAAAAAAARAATQLSEGELYGARLDAALAAGRASGELAARGAAGSVAVVGRSVTVTVRETVDHLLLPGSRTVSSSATSVATTGVITGSGP